MDKLKLIAKIRKFPDSPGVYFFKNGGRKILYIGKASSLRRRVISYFQRPQEQRIEKMLEKVAYIDTKQTESVIEALFFENEQIKKNQPKYNVRLKDDKTYLGIFVTSEDWPRVLPARLTEKLPKGEFYGPFPESTHVREALQIIRKIFPFRVSCAPQSGKACLEYHLGMCPGVCSGKVSKEEYQKTIQKIRMFLKGRKKQVIKNLEKEMKLLAKNLEFEKAAKVRDQVFALRHIQDVALIEQAELKSSQDIPSRIEAYDVSNISGAFAVGSMVVFSEGIIDKSQYRKFKIRTVKGVNDVEGIKEILSRRLNHKEWKMPDLILIDGGIGQVNGAKEVLSDRKLDIPVVGIAKGPDRKKNEIITPKKIPGQTFDIDLKLLIKIRDEAHRFAIEYYRLRHRKSLR